MYYLIPSKYDLSDSLTDDNGLKHLEHDVLLLFLFLTA